MTHDPMCWLSEWGDLYKVGHLACECTLIAKVRADERKRVGLRRNNVWDDAYAAALWDAVEAVKLSCSADIELVERSQVIADIEALGQKVNETVMYLTGE